MPQDQTPSARQGCMMFSVAAVFASVLVIGMVLITGGWFIYVIGVAAAIAIFVGLHYFLWGYFLTQYLAGEREEEELRQAERARRDYID